MSQQATDSRNAAFWNELCGTTFAHERGITDFSPESIRRFDEAFMAFYPYLVGYVLSENIEGKTVLEIGLGYGTLGQFLASQGCDYHGLDIAQGPVEMMRYRLGQLGIDSDRVRVGSALDIPCREGSFDYVYTIGCLHHTGDLRRAVSEVYRVLAPGGRAIVMLYNRDSFVYWVRAVLSLPTYVRERFLGRKPSVAQLIRAAYDSDTRADAAPYTEFVTQAHIKRLFKQFSSIHVDIQNFIPVPIPIPAFRQSGERKRWLYRIPREKLLNNLGRVVGSDFYITAQK